MIRKLQSAAYLSKPETEDPACNFLPRLVDYETGGKIRKISSLLREEGFQNWQTQKPWHIQHAGSREKA